MESNWSIVNSVLSKCNYSEFVYCPVDTVFVWHNKLSNFFYINWIKMNVLGKISWDFPAFCFVEKKMAVRFWLLFITHGFKILVQLKLFVCLWISFFFYSHNGHWSVSSNRKSDRLRGRAPIAPIWPQLLYRLIMIIFVRTKKTKTKLYAMFCFLLNATTNYL